MPVHARRAPSRPRRSSTSSCGARSRRPCHRSRRDPGASHRTPAMRDGPASGDSALLAGPGVARPLADGLDPGGLVELKRDFDLTVAIRARPAPSVTALPPSLVCSYRRPARRSQIAQKHCRARPIRTFAKHSIKSGVNTPTYRHAFSGRMPWCEGIGRGGQRQSPLQRPAAADRRTGRGRGGRRGTGCRPVVASGGDRTRPGGAAVAVGGRHTA